MPFLPLRSVGEVKDIIRNGPPCVYPVHGHIERIQGLIDIEYLLMLFEHSAEEG